MFRIGPSHLQPACVLLSTSSPASTGQTVVAAEALGGRSIQKPSLHSTLGNEVFHFAGHHVCIRESTDTYGALVWPGVGPRPALPSANTLCVHSRTRESERRLVL